MIGSKSSNDWFQVFKTAVILVSFNTAVILDSFGIGIAGNESEMEKIHIGNTF